MQTEENKKKKRDLGGNSERCDCTVSSVRPCNFGSSTNHSIPVPASPAGILPCPKAVSSQAVAMILLAPALIVRRKLLFYRD